MGCKKTKKIVIKCYIGLLVVRPGPVPLEMFLIPLGRRHSWDFRSSVCQSLNKMVNLKLSIVKQQEVLRLYVNDNKREGAQCSF